MNKQFVAALELVAAGIIWGFGFIATIWALESFSAVFINLIRFFLAFLVGITFIVFLKDQRKELKNQFQLAMIPGVLLGLLIILQTWGLKFTTATKSSFITTLYVVIVPVLQVYLLKKKLHPLHTIFVLGGLWGTALIMNLEWSMFNKGDFLTLICAHAAALQIIWIDKIRLKIKSPFMFNTYQSFWAGCLSLFMIPLFKEPFWQNIHLKALIGVISLTFASTMIAFAMQVRAQKVLSPSLASVLFLLEAPFAFIFAVLILNEQLTLIQVYGTILIFFSALGATLIETKKTKSVTM